MWSTEPLAVAAAVQAGTWTTVFNWSTDSFADDTGNNGFTHVFIIALSEFTQTGGTRIRLTFEGASTEGFIASAMYIGNGGGGDVYDFGDTPVQMTMGGSGTITVGAGVDVVTDDVAFVKDGVNSLVVASQLQNGAADNYRRSTSLVNDSFFKSGQDASTQNKTGYTHNFVSSYVKKIELLI